MRPLAPVLAASVVFAALLPAQDESTLTAREQELSIEAVQGLHAIADALQAEKQHLRALERRREIWMEYDEHDARARDKTGFVRIGSLWRMDEAKLVFDRDLKANKSKVRRIDRDLQKLEKRLLAEHRALAEGWAALAQPERAAKHWLRVLRFAPGDPVAAKALALREFEGFTGTEHELHILRRGRAIHGACDWLNRTEFPVHDLTDQQLPLLAAAQIEHIGVRSEFYTVWGSLPKDVLVTIAQDCERSLLLAHTLFGVSTGEVFRPRRMLNLVFVTDQDQYAATLEVCRDQFDESRFRFLRDAVEQCFVKHNGETLRVHKSDMGIEVTRDQAVRDVMQDAVGVQTHGLWEGIGHAACGLLFGRTLVFLEEQLTEKTVASWTQRRLSPDLAVWMQIAKESAWAKSDTRTSELVLVSAARFTTEQRVKAWAICHYFVHWRPELIFELDQSQTKDIHTPPDVEAEFLRRTQYELPKIDAEWRTFWSRGEQLRSAMVRDPLPDAKAKTRNGIERARQAVDAVNAQRAVARVGLLGYFVDGNPDFVAVRRYEQELAKAEREQQKRDKQQKKGARKLEPVEMPVTPDAIGRTVVWSRCEQAKQAVEQWLQRPAVRDLLLHPGRVLLAAPTDVGGFLLGTALPSQPAQRGLPLAWPRQGQTDVPGEVRVLDLGPRAMAALAKEGKSADDLVGMPLTLHFSRTVDPVLLAKVKCTVTDGNRPLDGVLLSYAPASVDGEQLDAADGCLAFLPLRAPAAGGTVEVRWQLPAEMLAKDETFASLSFTVR